MTFHDVRLPDEIERGALGGPSFKTTVLGMSSGHEQRNIDWSEHRHQWDIGYGISDKEDYSDVRAFYVARRGRGHGFRFKDWGDYQLGTEASPEVVGLGTGAATTFQIIKTYDPSGPEPYIRRVTRPVDGTVRVFLDGVEQMAGFTVNHATGVVTFSVAPGNGVEVGVVCEFDVPVRFDTDEFDLELTWEGAGSIGSLPICELRE